VDLKDRVTRGLLGIDLPWNDDWYGALNPETGERSLPDGIYLLYNADLRGAP
jgi:hypothetical protein